MSQEPAPDLGDLALDRGYVTREQLEDCRRGLPEDSDIGEALIARGYLSPDQLRTLLRTAPTVSQPAVGGRFYDCCLCKIRYELLGAAADATYCCSACRSLLLPVEAGVGRRPHQVRPASLMERPAALPPEVLEAARRPDRRVGKYILLGELGRGGTGTVYKAYDPELQRTTALKVLTVRHGEALERFHREAKTVARLKHPNIVSIYDIGTHEGHPFLAMDCIEGQTLDQIPGIPPRRAAELIRDAAQAVHYAHERGIIHRDLKPHNVLVDAGGIVWVTDFGVAREIGRGQSITAEGFTVGTPAYMSPEQATGRRDLDARTDVYSLGAMLYHVLTGRPPFTGHTDFETAVNVVHRRLRPPRRVKPEVPPKLEAVCLRAMHKDRERRYPTAGALAQDLQRFLDSKPVQARPPTLIDAAVQRVRRHRAIAWTIAASSVVVAAAIAVAVVSVRRFEDSERRLREAELRMKEEGRPPAAAPAPPPAPDLESEARALLEEARKAETSENRIELATRAIEYWPRLAEAYVLRAQARQGRGEHDRALEDYAKAAERAESPREALLARADLALEIGRYRLVIEDLGPAAAPSDEAFAVRIGQARLCEGDDEGALRSLEAAPDSTRVLVLRAFAKARSGRLDDAWEDALRGGTEPGSFAARTYVQARRGLEALRSADLPRLAEALAVTHYEAPRAAAHPLAGMARSAAEEFRAGLRKAEAERPDLNRALTTELAESASRRILGGEHLAASFLLALARERDPGNPLGPAFEGLSCALRGDFGNAMELGHRAVTLDPACLEGRAVRGFGRLRTAVAILQRERPLPGIEGDQDPLWLRYLAEALEDVQEFLAHSPRAETWRALHPLPDYPRTVLAGVQEELGAAPARLLAARLADRARGRLEARDPACARDLATRALSLGAEEARTLALRGRAFLALGRRAEAESDLRRAVELDPELEAELSPLVEEAARRE